MRRIMTYLSDFPGAIVAQHSEDKSIAGGGHLNEGAVSQLLGINGLPAVAEEVVIARDLVLAAETGARYHAQHISTKGSVELIRRAKEAGLPVTAEVTPHHLALSEDACQRLDPNTKMYPPLRSPDDVEAVRAALAAGEIDVVATDHAPHLPAEKDVPFEQAPRGIIGLETAFPLVLQGLDGDLEAVFRRMSIGPAAIAGIDRHGRFVEKGSPANLVLVDPFSSWTVSKFESKSSNSPLVGHVLQGKVIATIFEGDLVHGRDS
jgi:dihydroorotase